MPNIQSCGICRRGSQSNPPYPPFLSSPKIKLHYTSVRAPTNRNGCLENVVCEDTITVRKMLTPRFVSPRTEMAARNVVCEDTITVRKMLKAIFLLRSSVVFFPVARCFPSVNMNCIAKLQNLCPPEPAYRRQALAKELC